MAALAHGDRPEQVAVVANKARELREVKADAQPAKKGKRRSEGLQPRWSGTVATAPVAEKKTPNRPYPGENAGDGVRTGW
jgi:hypothetical protein